MLRIIVKKKKLGQKGLCIWAMVGMLHIAGNCRNNKKPNPVDIQGAKINKLGTVTQQTPRPINTENTQDISEKLNPADIQGTNKLSTTTQQTSPPEGEVPQIQLKTITNPISKKIPQERHTQEKPNISKEMVEISIATAKYAALKLAEISFSTSKQINEIRLAKEFVSGIDKAVKAIREAYSKWNTEKLVNGKYFADKAQPFFIIRNPIESLAEEEMAKGVFTELGTKQNSFNQKTLEVLKDIENSFKNEVTMFKRTTKEVLKNLKEVMNTASKHISEESNAIQQITSLTENNQYVIIEKFNVSNTKLIEIRTTLGSAKEHVATLKTEAVKRSQIQETLNMVIDDLDTKRDELNKAITDTIETVKHAITDLKDLEAFEEIV